MEINLTVRSRSHGIRLLTPPSTSKYWTWRSDWVTGFESVLCLLAYFQILNVVPTYRVASIFAASTMERRSARGRRQPVDLHRMDQIESHAVLDVMGLGADQIRKAFVSEAFPGSAWCASSHLRWCPRCVTRGFHGLVCQLGVQHVCPSHGLELLDRCPNCGGVIPYKLLTAKNAPLSFVCPACGNDLIGEFRRAMSPSPLRPVDVEAMESEQTIVHICDGLPTVMGGVLTAPDGKAFRELSFAVPRGVDGKRAFAEFAKGVMSGLSGGNGTVMQPSNQFIEARPVAMQVRRSNGAAGGWPVHVVRASDKRLRMACGLYRAVRREIWRGLLHQHHRCVISAAKTIWWPIMGEKTVAFCRPAMAFIRWRMFWEGLSDTSGLLARPRTTPLGLATWLSAIAPIGSASWSDRMCDWLVCHVLGRELLASFRTLLLQAHADMTEQRTMSWNRTSLESLPRVGWLCAGRGTYANPGRFFAMAVPAIDSRDMTTTGMRSHRKWHDRALSKIVH